MLISAAYLLWAANASASERQTYPYNCGDGQAYAVWVDPEPMGGFTAKGPRLQFRAFCTSKAKSIIECIKDESYATQYCFKEFKDHGNLSRYEGSSVIIGNNFREPPRPLPIVKARALEASKRKPASVIRPLPVARNK